MATLTSPLKIARSGLVRDSRQGSREAQNINREFRPQLIEIRQDAQYENRGLRMYTEEQVAELLQISLSKLRKWRMKKNSGDEKGPPFKKIGRLVRYPEAALAAYINGE